MTMRPAVAKAWPVHVDHFEGTLSWMYLDTKYKVTTGVGNLIDSPAAARGAGTWYDTSGAVATPEEVDAEWRRVKALTGLAKQSGWAYRKSAELTLTWERVAELLLETTQRFWLGLIETWPAIDRGPADLQLAALDLAWQNGYDFLEVKDRDTGKYIWPNMRAAWLAEDWAAAANAVPGTGERADSRKRLLRNAAKAIAVGADPEVLWDTATPIAPPITHEENDIMAAGTGFYKDYVGNQPLAVGDNQVWINADRDTSLVFGENDGVDLTAVVDLDGAPADTRVAFRIVQVKDGLADKTQHTRRATVGDTAHFKGSIKGEPAEGRQLRLRVIVTVPAPAAGQPAPQAKVRSVQVTGWIL